MELMFDFEQELTKDFKLKEFCFKRDGAYVMPPDYVINELVFLCKYYLQPLRDIVGPVSITSGYRDEEKNRSVGGSKNSYHMRGLACDIAIASIEAGLVLCYHLLRIQDDLQPGFKLAELILNRKTGYVHVAMRDIGDLDKKLYFEVI